MTTIAETTLRLVRDKHIVGMAWLLHEILGAGTDHSSGAALGIRNEIHRALLGAGWRHICEDGSGAAAIHIYERPIGDSAHSSTLTGPRRPDDGPEPTAPEILAAAAHCIQQRAATRDLPAERSMARTVTAFNAIAGHRLDERDGWLFMAILKAARATAGSHNPDDYVDGAAYFALAGESAAMRRPGP